MNEIGKEACNFTIAGLFGIGGAKGQVYLPFSSFFFSSFMSPNVSA